MALTKIGTDGVKDDAVTSGKIPANAVGSSELADQSVSLDKLPHGTSSTDGKFLRANNGADPTFETVTSTNIIGNADNRVITGSGTANTLNGESNLTFSSSLLLTDGNGSSNLGGNYLLLKRTSGTTNYLNAPLADGELYISADEAIRFATVHTADFNSTERMRIDSSGNVGIGTTNPSQFHSSADDLVIQQNGHAGITIDSTSAHNSSVFFADGPTGGEAYAGYIQYSHSSDELRLGAATNDRVQIRQNEVEIVDGDLIIGTAGHGIQFDVNGSGSDQLLDDYEEGTHTLTTNANLTLNSNYNVAQYTKIGNVVTMTMLIFVSSVSSNNQVTVSLPFVNKSGTSSSRCDAIGSIMHNGVNTGSAGIVSYIGNGSNHISFYNLSTNGNWAAVNNSDLNANDEMYLTVVYRTA